MVPRTLHTFVFQIEVICLLAKALAAEALNSLITFLFKVSYPYYKIEDPS